MVLKVSPCYIYIMYITVLGRTDFEHPIFSIISSQSCFIEMDLSQKMLLLLGHEKNFVYSKLVNNPFNHLYLYNLLVVLLATKGQLRDDSSSSEEKLMRESVKFLSFFLSTTRTGWCGLLTWQHGRVLSIINPDNRTNTLDMIFCIKHAGGVLWLRADIK